MELDKEKQYILKNSPSKSVVISAAGSGKTALMTEKVRQVLKTGVDPAQVAVITFTRMAAEELRSRLDDDYKDGLFIGTVHSLAYHLLVKAGVNVNQYVEDEEFDELFGLVMENPHCLKKFQWIFLDEAQDSSILQFEFLFEILNPDNFFVVGDHRQSIFEWAGGNYKLLEGLGNRFDVDKFHITSNYRCKKEILDFGKRILEPTKMIDDSIAVRGYGGIVDSGSYKAQRIYYLVNRKKDYGNWFILTRTNKQLWDIWEYLSEKSVPVDTFKQSDLNRELLGKKMKENTVKVLTAHSSKGLGIPKVIAVGMQYYSKEERRLGYVAATRAKDELYWMRIAKRRFR